VPCSKRYGDGVPRLGAKNVGRGVCQMIEAIGKSLNGRLYFVPHQTVRGVSALSIHGRSS